MLEWAVLSFAFGGGLVAAFNPCGAAMFPAYVGYQLDAAEVGNPVSSAIRGILMGFAVTAGFLVVFGVIGVILALGGRLIADFLPFLGLSVGVVITAAGLWLLLSRRHIGFMAASRVNLGSGKGYRQVFLFGIAYAIASLSCALPIFLASVGIVVGQGLSAGGTIDAISGSLAYGAGMGAIMMAATLGVVFFKGLISKGMRVVFPIIEPIGNLAMVGAGSYLIWYWLFGTGSVLLEARVEELTLGGVALFVGIIASLTLYFVPTIIALARKKSNTVAIFALNLLLGWSIIGWVRALGRSLTTEQLPLATNDADRALKSVGDLEMER